MAQTPDQQFDQAKRDVEQAHTLLMVAQGRLFANADVRPSVAVSEALNKSLNGTEALINALTEGD